MRGEEEDLAEAVLAEAVVLDEVAVEAMEEEASVKVMEGQAIAGPPQRQGKARHSDEAAQFAKKRKQCPKRKRVPPSRLRA